MSTPTPCNGATQIDTEITPHVAQHSGHSPPLEFGVGASTEQNPTIGPSPLSNITIAGLQGKNKHIAQLGSQLSAQHPHSTGPHLDWLFSQWGEALTRQKIVFMPKFMKAIRHLEEARTHIDAAEVALIMGLDVG